MNENVRPTLAIVRTQLPYVDRRSLSEAWFSALHLAGGQNTSTAAHARAGASAERDVRRRACVPSESRANGAPLQSPAARRYAAAVATNAVIGDAKIVRADASRAASVRPAMVRPRSYPPQRTSLTVGVEGSRVQLVLRRDGDVLHVIALCRPSVAAIVSAALARADAQLRLRGESVRASVRTTNAGVDA